MNKIILNRYISRDIINIINKYLLPHLDNIKIINSINSKQLIQETSLIYFCLSNVNIKLQRLRHYSNKYWTYTILSTI